MSLIASANSPSQSPSAASPAAGSANPASLDELLTLVAGDMQKVDTLIQARMSSDVPMIPELASHLVNAGGKRVRPMVTLAAAGMLGYKGEHHHRLAATVEFIHTATLLHDDVVDESALRRGLPSANTVWGNAASVLVGDFLFSQSFSLMVETGSLRVLEILSNASRIIAEGEVAQLASAHDLDLTEDKYFTIIRGKTAALFSAAAQIAAVINQSDPAKGQSSEQALADYGMHLGLAFQLVDDALDYDGAQADLGKRVGDDFREGKVTLPVVLALARGDAEDRAFWQRTMMGLDQSDADLAVAIAKLRDSKALDDTLALARTHADAAQSALAQHFEDNAYRSALMGLAAFVVARAY